jgi:hypothetical protein
MAATPAQLRASGWLGVLRQSLLAPGWPVRGSPRPAAAASQRQRRTLAAAAAAGAAERDAASNAPSERAGSYPFGRIEGEWQNYWLANRTYRTPPLSQLDTSRPKFYALDMFPVWATALHRRAPAPDAALCLLSAIGLLYGLVHTPPMSRQRLHMIALLRLHSVSDEAARRSTRRGRGCTSATPRGTPPATSWRGTSGCKAITSCTQWVGTRSASQRSSTRLRRVSNGAFLGPFLIQIMK